MRRPTEQHVALKSPDLKDVKGYARQILRAGLGSYNKADQENASLFKDLVQARGRLEVRDRQHFSHSLEGVQAQLNSMRSGVAGVREKVELQFDKLEQEFDARVAHALHRLGIPSKQDIKALSQRLDALQAALNQLKND